MATRPAWTVKDGVVVREDFSFAWNGGPYLDLLHVLPKEAKRDDRHKSSGPLSAFVWNQEIWPLMPKTAFY